jgi:hypothetical protein
MGLDLHRPQFGLHRLGRVTVAYMGAMRHAAERGWSRCPVISASKAASATRPAAATHRTDTCAPTSRRSQARLAEGGRTVHPG